MDCWKKRAESTVIPARFKRELEELLVLEEGDKVGSPFGKQCVRVATVGDMEEGRLHDVNIRKNAFLSNVIIDCLSALAAAFR